MRVWTWPREEEEAMVEAELRWTGRRGFSMEFLFCFRTGFSMEFGEGERQQRKRRNAVREWGLGTVEGEVTLS